MHHVKVFSDLQEQKVRKLIKLTKFLLTLIGNVRTRMNSGVKKRDYTPMKHNEKFWNECGLISVTSYTFTSNLTSWQKTVQVQQMHKVFGLFANVTK